MVFSIMDLRSTSSSLFTLIYFSSQLLFLFTSTTEASTKVPAIFLFGDSFSDQGNNNYLATPARANFLPYGKDFMDGNRPTGRFSNGKTLGDLMAGSLGIKEFLPPYLDPNLQLDELVTGVSFGSAGSGYDPQTSAITRALSLPKQLESFKDYMAKIKGNAPEDSIFLVIAGSVDFTLHYTTPLRRIKYNVDSYTTFLVQLASKFVQDLYALGAKKMFVFGSPPIGCFPYQRTLLGGISRNCFEEQNEASHLYNSKLLNAITNINGNLSSADPKASVTYVDFYNPLYNLIQDHTENGFVVADRGCCGTGSVEFSVLCNPLTPTCSNATTYVFWDSFHPTERGNIVLVDQFLENSFSMYL